MTATNALSDFVHPTTGYDVGLFEPTGNTGSPVWSTLKSEITSKMSGTIAIVDNTTACNSLRLLEAGLGNKEFSPAAHLPDLHVLFFALTHFDHLLVFDHGSSTEELQRLGTFLPDETMLPLTIPIGASAGPSLSADLEDKFSRIQREFLLKRLDLHKPWSAKWGSLLGGEVAEPIGFTVGNSEVTEEIEGLLNSPKHPLQKDRDLFDASFPTGFGQVPTIALGRLGSPERERSVYASYHTYRTMFYHALAGYLGHPYVPCGIRSVMMDVFPLGDLVDEKTIRDHAFVRQLEQYAPSKRLKFLLPTLKISPSLAAAFDAYARLSKGEHPKSIWKEVIGELRSQSAGYRQLIGQLLVSCDQGDALEIERILHLMKTHPGKEVIEDLESASKAVIEITAGHFLGALKEAVLLLLKSPWEALRNLATHWRLRFILTAKNLAKKSLSLEHQCEKVWGRRFTERERGFLTALAESAHG
jgi:hypothetical protein